MIAGYLYPYEQGQRHNDIFYTGHALERMAPNTPGFVELLTERTIARGNRNLMSEGEWQLYMKENLPQPRSILPGEVEEAIIRGQNIEEGDAVRKMEHNNLVVVLTNDRTVITAYRTSPPKVKENECIRGGFRQIKRSFSLYHFITRFKTPMINFETKKFIKTLIKQDKALKSIQRHISRELKFRNVNYSQHAAAGKTKKKEFQPLNSYIFQRQGLFYDYINSQQRQPMYQMKLMYYHIMKRKQCQIRYLRGLTKHRMLKKKKQQLTCFTKIQQRKRMILWKKLIALNSTKRTAWKMNRKNKLSSNHSCQLPDQNKQQKQQRPQKKKKKEKREQTDKKKNKNNNNQQKKNSSKKSTPPPQQQQQLQQPHQQTNEKTTNKKNARKNNNNNKSNNNNNNNNNANVNNATITTFKRKDKKPTNKVVNLEAFVKSK